MKNKKPDDSIEFIRWLFNGRCIGIDSVCQYIGTDRSHIIPKSRGKIAQDWKNIVLQCSECHGEYHRRGASKKEIENLQIRREKQLIMLGRSEFV